MADFIMWAGDDKTLQVTVQDSSGDPVDITGATAIRWQLSKSATKRPALIEKALLDGVTVISAPGGRFDVTLEPEDTEDLKGDYYHEAELIDSGGRVATVLTGTATINPALIKPA